jgi:hypothetical protein
VTVPSRRGDLARLASFGVITVVFAVTQPLMLVGLPLALMLVTFGPRSVTAALVVGVAVTVAALGDRSGLWWFERGWALLLAGAFVWLSDWRSEWGFVAKALAAVWLAAAVAAVIFAARPDVWLDVDALMTSRASESAASAARLLGDRADDTVRGLMQRVVALQVAVFPALLGVSSLAALGVVGTLHGWLGDRHTRFGDLKNFRFNDHLVWVWLIGLALLLAPIGGGADRIGGNAVLFMGALYVVRGAAVALSLVGGVPMTVGILGGLVALVLYPVLVLLAGAMLIVGLGDTWLNVRARVRARGAGSSPGDGEF